MLSRVHRFHGHNTVRRAYHQGSSFRHGSMSLHVNVNNRSKAPKVAVVVSRKVHKSAVKRNRIRRRIYEVVRHEIANLEPTQELVFTVYRADLAEVSAKELKDTVMSLMSKAGIIK